MADDSLKLLFMSHLNEYRRDNRLTQVKFAKLLGVSQPRIAALARYDFKRFSIGTLMHYCRRLDIPYFVTIGEKPKTRTLAL